MAVGSWAVRSRRINPFSGAARLIRNLTDPAIDPIERWQLKRGGNPQHAPWWLLGITVVAGILVITVAQWLAVQLVRTTFAWQTGPRGLLRLAIYYLGQLVLIALIVRVVASWFGLFGYSRGMRPVYFLTEWIVGPLRKIVPPLGMIDITPLIAWLLMQFVLGWLMRVI